MDPTPSSTIELYGGLHHYIQKLPAQLFANGHPLRRSARNRPDLQWKRPPTFASVPLDNMFLSALFFTRRAPHAASNAPACVWDTFTDRMVISPFCRRIHDPAARGHSGPLPDSDPDPSSARLDERTNVFIPLPVRTQKPFFRVAIHASPVILTSPSPSFKLQLNGWVVLESGPGRPLAPPRKHPAATGGFDAAPQTPEALPLANCAPAKTS